MVLYGFVFLEEVVDLIKIFWKIQKPKPWISRSSSKQVVPLAGHALAPQPLRNLGFFKDLAGGKQNVYGRSNVWK